jgi:hypothetical protein
MSEFSVHKTRHGKWGVYMPNGAILDSFISEQKAVNRANYLNEGSAALRIPVTEPTMEQKINDFARISVELQNEVVKPLQERIAELEAWQKGALEDFETIALKAKRMLWRDDRVSALSEGDKALVHSIYTIAKKEPSTEESGGES